MREFTPENQAAVGIMNLRLHLVSDVDDRRRRGTRCDQQLNRVRHHARKLGVYDDNGGLAVAEDVCTRSHAVCQKRRW